MTYLDRTEQDGTVTYKGHDHAAKPYGIEGLAKAGVMPTLWLGRTGVGARCLLTQDMVAAMLPFLVHFAMHGALPGPSIPSVDPDPCHPCPTCTPLQAQALDAARKVVAAFMEGNATRAEAEQAIARAAGVVGDGGVVGLRATVAFWAEDGEGQS